MISCPPQSKNPSIYSLMMRAHGRRVERLILPFSVPEIAYLIPLPEEPNLLHFAEEKQTHSSTVGLFLFIEMKRVWLFWQENDDTMSGTLNGRIGLSNLLPWALIVELYVDGFLAEEDFRKSSARLPAYLYLLFRSSSDPLKITLSPMARRQGSYSVSRAPRHTNEAKFIAEQLGCPVGAVITMDEDRHQSQKLFCVGVA